MDWIANILLAAGALGTGFFCLILSRRLRRFTDLEHGVGGAVAVLSAQVDDLTIALRAAQSSATSSVAELSDATRRADAAVGRIELALASINDIPETEKRVVTPPPLFERRQAQMVKRA